MEDQLNALGKSNIEAAMISSTLRGKQVTAILSRLTEKNCTLKIMYVTPEKIAKSKQFMSKLEKADKSKIFLHVLNTASLRLLYGQWKQTLPKMRKANVKLFLYFSGFLVFSGYFFVFWRLLRS